MLSKLPAQHVAGEHQRLAAKPRGGERGGEAGDARAGDDDVVRLVHGYETLVMTRSCGPWF